jgi:Sulfotransferase domain
MPLTVIGAGLGRTGTLSLKLALEQLGAGPCYHMKEVFAVPDASDQWRRAAEGEAVDWEVVFAGYRATVDWPAAQFYKQLAARYPEAKIILSLRDAESWFRSTQATIFADPTFPGAPPAWRAMVQRVITEPMGGRLDDRETLIARYRAHNDEVQRVIPRERLLVFEATEGWPPLCAFLGVPVPSEPYPRTNTTDEWIERMRGAS